MNLEILEKDVGYTILLEGVFFRHCKTYTELAQTMGSLVKGKFMKDMSGGI